MNTIIRHGILYLLTLSALLFHYSCKKSMNPLGTIYPGDMALEDSINVRDIHNIIWTLDKSGYEPFHLIFKEDHFLGDDGCNRFGGRYSAKNDSIFPRDVVQTEMACNVTTYSIQHLTEPFRIQISKNRLDIFAQHNTLTYKSDHANDLVRSPLLGNWSLTFSTDPEFENIQTQLLTPTLLLQKNRGFKIAWYCNTDNIFGCDEIFGLFGTGDNNKILFYPTGWKNHSAGLDFMYRILNSSFYSVETVPEFTSLKLFNEEENTEYKFHIITK